MGVAGFSRLEASANHSSEKEWMEAWRTEVAREVRCEKVVGMRAEGMGVVVMVEVELEVGRDGRRGLVSEEEAEGVRVWMVRSAGRDVVSMVGVGLSGELLRYGGCLWR